MEGISKRFERVQANRDAGLEIRAGEIRGLVGENGAGKTTLMNIASGLYQPDAGRLEIDGRETRFASPHDAIRAGISMVPQNFMVAENMTAAENVVLGAPGPAWVTQAAMRSEIEALSARYQLPVDPDRPVWRMPLGERQRVAILTALYRDCRVLLLDEPTSVLSPPQIESLLETIRRLAAEGCSVVFITHKLEEIVDVCDHVTVMRKGEVIQTVARADADAASLAELMVGRDLGTWERRPSRHVAGEPILEVRGLTVRDDRDRVAVNDVDLDVRGGEILGLAGVDGNGQHELLDAIAGLREPSTGTIDRTSADDVDIAYVPDDPRAEALVPTLPLSWNVALRYYRSQRSPRRPRWLMDHGRLRELTRAIIARFDVRDSEPGTPASALSGGNLQKLLLGRELSLGSQVLLAMNPTAGLDVGAAAYVRDVLVEERDRGVGVVLASNDLDEVLRLADRVAVMYRGSVVAQMTAAEATRERVGGLMAGLSADPSGESDA